MTTIGTINDDHFDGGANLNKGSRSSDGAAILEELLSAAKVDIGVVEVASGPGIAATAQLVLTNQPVANDTLVIGDDTYEFDGAGANKNVVIGASAEATIDNLVVAINSNGIENVIADKLAADTMRLRTAASPGGAVAAIPASFDIGLDASDMTNAAWNEGDVNMNTLAGKAAGVQTVVRGSLTITTAMVTATEARISFPFTPTGFLLKAISSDAEKPMTTDTVKIDNGDLLLGLGTDLANGDIVYFVVWA